MRKSVCPFDCKAPLRKIFNLAHSIPYSAIHINLSYIISTFLVTVNTNKCFNNIFGYMQKNTLFTSLSFLLKVQFVRQITQNCSATAHGHPAYVLSLPASAWDFYGVWSPRRCPSGCWVARRCRGKLASSGETIWRLNSKDIRMEDALGEKLRIEYFHLQVSDL